METTNYIDVKGEVMTPRLSGSDVTLNQPAPHGQKGSKQDSMSRADEKLKVEIKEGKQEIDYELERDRYEALLREKAFHERKEDTRTWLELTDSFTEFTGSSIDGPYPSKIPFHNTAVKMQRYGLIDSIYQNDTVERMDNPASDLRADLVSEVRDEMVELEMLKTMTREQKFQYTCSNAYALRRFVKATMTVQLATGKSSFSEEIPNSRPIQEIQLWKFLKQNLAEKDYPEGCKRIFQAMAAAKKNLWKECMDCLHSSTRAEWEIVIEHVRKNIKNDQMTYMLWLRSKVREARETPRKVVDKAKEFASKQWQNATSSTNKWIPSFTLKHEMPEKLQTVAEAGMNEITLLRKTIEDSMKKIGSHLEGDIVDKTLLIVVTVINAIYVPGVALKISVLTQGLLGLGLHIYEKIKNFIRELAEGLHKLAETYLINQKQEKEEVVAHGEEKEEDQSWIAGFLESLCGFFSISIFETEAPKIDVNGTYSAEITKLGRLASAVTSIGKCIEYLSKLVWTAVSWVFLKIMGRPLVLDSTRVLVERAIKWMEKATVFIVNNKADKFAASPTFCHELIELEKEGLIINKEIVQVGYTKHTFTPFFKMLDDIKMMANLARTFLATSRNRVPPVAIHLVGRPGQGKSMLAKVLATMMFDYYNKYILKIGTQPWTSNIMWSQPKDSEYFDTYANNFCVLMDDIWQSVVDEDMLKKALEIVYMYNDTAYPLNMAVADLKGKMFFDSKLLITTANGTALNRGYDCKTPPIKLMQDRNAYLRRRDMVLEVVLESQDELSLSGWKFYQIDPMTEERLNPEAPMLDIADVISKLTPIFQKRMLASSASNKWLSEMKFEDAEKIKPAVVAQYTEECTVILVHGQFTEVPQVGSVHVVQHWMSTLNIVGREREIGIGTGLTVRYILHDCVYVVDPNNETLVRIPFSPGVTGPQEQVVAQYGDDCVGILQHGQFSRIPSVGSVHVVQDSISTPDITGRERLIELGAKLTVKHIFSEGVYVVEPGNSVVVWIPYTCGVRKLEEEMEMHRSRIERENADLDKQLVKWNIVSNNSFLRALAKYKYLTMVIVLGAIGSLIAGAWYIYSAFFGNKIESQGAPGPYNNEKQNGQWQPKLESKPLVNKLEKLEVVAQSSASIENIRPWLEGSLSNHMGKFAVQLERGGESRSCGILFLKNRWGVTALHMMEFGNRAHSVITIDTPRMEKMEFFRKDLVCEKDPFGDLVYIRFPKVLQPFSSLAKHFITKEEFMSANISSILLYVKKPGLPAKEKFSTVVNKQANYEYTLNGPGTKKIVCSNVLTYNSGGEKGDCASPVIAMNTHVQCPIVGLHVAGSIGTGVANVVCRETIEALPDEEEEVKAQGGEEAILLPEGKPRFEYSGNLAFVGKVKKEFKQRMVNKNPIVPSPFAGKFQEPITGPSKIRPFENLTGEKISPMQVAVTKFSNIEKSQHEWDKPLLRSIIKDFVQSVPYYVEPVMLNVKDAINVPQGYSRTAPIHMGTADGFDITGETPKGQKGKQHLFTGSPGHFVPIYQLAKRIETQFEKHSKGERYPVINVACQKTERLPLEKCELGKTRLFQVSPTETLVEGRQLFGAFYECVNTLGLESNVASGINPHSLDWTLLYYRQTSLSEPRNHTYDAKCFEGSHPAVLGELYAEEVNAWYFQGVKRGETSYEDWVKQSQARKMIISETMNNVYVIIADDLVIAEQWFQSGVFDTFLRNSLFGYFIKTYADLVLERILKTMTVFDASIFLGIGMRETRKFMDGSNGWNLGLKEHKQFTRDMNAGDDVWKTYDKPWHFITMPVAAKMLKICGYTYTTSDKKEIQDEWTDTQDVTFLKRKFVKRQGIFLAPMEIHDIVEILNWVNEEPFPADEMFALSCVSAIREFAHHGKDVFEEWKNKLNECLAEIRRPLLTVSYEDFFEESTGAGTAIDMSEFMVVQHTQEDKDWKLETPGILLDNMCKHVEEMNVKAIEKFVETGDITAQGSDSDPDDFTPKLNLGNYNEENEEETLEEKEWIQMVEEENEPPDPSIDEDKLWSKLAHMYYPESVIRKERRRWINRRGKEMAETWTEAMWADDRKRVEKKIAEQKAFLKRLEVGEEVLEELGSSDSNEEAQMEAETPALTSVEGLTGIEDEKGSSPTTTSTGLVPLFTGMEVYEGDQVGDGKMNHTYRLTTVAWSSASGQGVGLYAAHFPYALINASTNLQYGINFKKFMRADVVLEIRINGSAFHYGTLACGVLPRCNNPDTVPGKMLSVYDISQCNMVLIRPNVNRPVRIVIPYVSEHPFWRHDEDDDHAYMGTAKIVVYNPLSNIGSSTVPSVQMTVFAKFENVVLAGPTLHTYTPDPLFGIDTDIIAHMKKEQVAKSEKMTLSGVMNSLSGVASVVKMIPIPMVSAAAAVGEKMLSYGSTFAKAIGYNKPNSVSAPSQLKQFTTYGMSQGEGLNITKDLSMDPSAAIATDPNHFGMSIDEHKMSHLVMKPALWNLFNFNATATTGTVLYSFRVRPTTCYCYNAASTTPKVAHMTPLAAIATQFKLWRGTIKYYFEVDMPSTAAVFLRFSWHPDFSEIPGTFSNDGDFVQRIVECRGFTRVKFCVPYLAQSLYSLVSLPDAPDTGNAGGIAISVVSPIVSASSLGGSVVYITCYIAGDDDMEFELATGNVGTLIVSDPAVVSVIAQMEDEETDVLDEIFAHKFPPLVPAHAIKIGKIISGEKSFSETDIRTFMHRFTERLQNVTFNHNNWTQVQEQALFFSNAVGTGTTSYDLWNVVFNWALYRRGGYNIKLFRQGQQLGDGYFLVEFAQFSDSPGGHTNLGQGGAEYYNTHIDGCVEFSMPWKQQTLFNTSPATVNLTNSFNGAQFSAYVFWFSNLATPENTFIRYWASLRDDYEFGHFKGVPHMSWGTSPAPTGRKK